MIVTLEEVKLWCKIDDNLTDTEVQELINFAENYLYNATGKIFDNTNYIAKQYCKALICELYEERTLTKKDNRKDYSEILKSCMAQLSHCYQPPPEVVE